MPEGNLAELQALLLGLVVQEPELIVLNAILAIHLLDEQLAVALDDQAFAAQLGSPLQGLHQGGIFRDVVGRFAETGSFLIHRLAVADNYVSIGSRPWITSGGAVNVNRKKT